MPLRRGDRTGVAPLLTALWRRARAPPALHPHSPSRQPCRAHTCSAPCPGTRGTRRRKGEGARAAPPRTHAPLVRQCVLDDGAPNRDEGPPLAWHAGVRGGTPRGSLSPPVPVSQPVVVASADGADPLRSRCPPRLPPRRRLRTSRRARRRTRRAPRGPAAQTRSAMGGSARRETIGREERG